MSKECKHWDDYLKRPTERREITDEDIYTYCSECGALLSVKKRVYKTEYGWG